MRDRARHTWPVAWHARDIAQPHVILPFGKNHLGCPMRVAADHTLRRIQPLHRAAIMPARAVIGADSHSDRRSMDPAVFWPVRSRLTIGVKHPPLIGALLAD